MTLNPALHLHVVAKCGSAQHVQPWAGSNGAWAGAAGDLRSRRPHGAAGPGAQAACARAPGQAAGRPPAAARPPQGLMRRARARGRAGGHRDRVVQLLCADAQHGGLPGQPLPHAPRRADLPPGRHGLLVLARLRRPGQAPAPGAPPGPRGPRMHTPKMHQDALPPARALA